MPSPATIRQITPIQPVLKTVSRVPSPSARIEMAPPAIPMVLSFGATTRETLRRLLAKVTSFRWKVVLLRSERMAEFPDSGGFPDTIQAYVGLPVSVVWEARSAQSGQ